MIGAMSWGTNGKVLARLITTNTPGSRNTLPEDTYSNLREAEGANPRQPKFRSGSSQIPKKGRKRGNPPIGLVLTGDPTITDLGVCSQPTFVLCGLHLRLACNDISGPTCPSHRPFVRVSRRMRSFRSYPSLSGAIQSKAWSRLFCESC